MFDNQVSNVVKSCYLELTLIAKVKTFPAFILSGSSTVFFILSPQKRKKLTEKWQTGPPN